MSGSQTHGFDLVFELSETRLQQIIEGLNVIPREVSVALPFRMNNQSVHAVLNGGVINRVSIDVNNRLEVQVSYGTMSIAGIPLGGVDITAKCHIDTDGANPRRLQFTFSMPPLISPRNRSQIEALVALANTRGTTLTYDGVIAMAENAVLNFLQTSVMLPAIPLGVPLGTGRCALSLSDLQVRTIPGSLFILLLVSGAGIPHSIPPNLNAFSSSLLNGRDSIMLVSNESLLAAAACFATEPPSPLTGAHFVSSGGCQTLASPFSRTLDGRQITINTLNLCVVGNEIIISGAAMLSGVGYSINGTFRAPISFTCRSNGTVVPNFDPNRIQTTVSVHLEWWVYALSFGLAAVAAIFLGPITGLLLNIVVVLLAPILSLVANAVVNSALPGLGQAADRAVEQGLRMVPPELIDILGRLNCQAVILDDLSLTGVLISAPAATVGISQDWRVVDRRSLRTGDAVAISYEDFAVSRTGLLRAVATHIPTPIQYQWMLNGLMLGSSGTVTLDGVNIHYQVSGNTCQLSTPLGGSINTIVNVRVQGGNGYTLTTSKLVIKEGTERRYDSQLLSLLTDLQNNLVYLQGTPPLWRSPIPLPDPAPDAFSVRNLDNDIALAISIGMGINRSDLAA